LTEHKIVLGDSRQLNLIPDKSVQLIVTSPPYWQLKDYGTDEQIGFKDNYEDYINNLNLVWKECCRVLSDGCRLCVNIGDQFARSVYYGRYKVIPIRTEIIKCCEYLGLDYMGAIIWQKTTTMNTTGGGAVMGSFPYPRNGILKMDYEFILLFKKLGKAPKPTSKQKEMSKLSKEEWNEYFSSHWNFNGVRQQGHLAMFPEELPKRIIKMFSFVGETVFDPFLGSGTTSLAAKNLGRNSVGYEINSDFIPYINDKLNIGLNEFSNSRVEFLEDAVDVEKLNNDGTSYVFIDPHKLDKKVDVKKLTYGSKIDNHTVKSKDLFTVKRIISPEKIVLNNDLTIRLIGIKSKPQDSSQAMEYLTQKTNKRKVFLKFDDKKYDDQNNLLCYLYLDNKTFLNNHLLRTGFVDLDDSYDYSCKQKFADSIPL